MEAMTKRSTLGMGIMRGNTGALDLPREGVRGRESERAARPQVQPEIRSGAALKQRKSFGLSVFLGAGFYVVLAVLLMIVYSYVELTELSDSAVKYKAQIKSLKVEETRLINEHESRLSLTSVEEYAVTKLGMVKPEREQIVYLDLSGVDHAVVADNRERDEFGELLDGMYEKISSLLAYLN